MSSSIDGRRRKSSGQGCTQKPANTKLIWPTTLRVDAPIFKPASPPKSNPWINFASKSKSESTPEQSLSDPPLPSQVRNEEEDQLAHGTGRLDAPGRSRRRDSTGSKLKLFSPASRSSWADETTRDGPVHSDNGHITEEAIRATNPWFSSSNPFTRRTKANSEPAELCSLDPPLPPISESGSPSGKPDNEVPSKKSKSTVLGSLLRHETSLAGENEKTVQAERIDWPAPNEARSRTPRTEKPRKASRPPSRDSTHSLSSAGTALRTVRSASSSSEDSRRAAAAAAVVAGEIGER